MRLTAADKRYLDLYAQIREHAEVKDLLFALDEAVGIRLAEAEKRGQRRRPFDPVGIPEVAERLGVKRSTVDQWRQRDLMPAPQWTIGGRPAWNWGDIEIWAEGTDRLPAKDHENPTLGYTQEVR